MWIDHADPDWPCHMRDIRKRGGRGRRRATPCCRGSGDRRRAGRRLRGRRRSRPSGAGRESYGHAAQRRALLPPYQHRAETNGVTHLGLGSDDWVAAMRQQLETHRICMTTLTASRSMSRGPDVRLVPIRPAGRYFLTPTVRCTARSPIPVSVSCALPTSPSPSTSCLLPRAVPTRSRWQGAPPRLIRV